MDGPCYIVLATTVMLHVVGNLSFKDYFGTFQGPIFVGLVAGVPAIKRILLNRITCGINSAQYYKVVYVVVFSNKFFPIVRLSTNERDISLNNNSTNLYH